MNNKDKIVSFVKSRNWEGMRKMLNGLSNAEFRKMEQVARCEVLAKLDNALFWEMLLHLIYFKRQAFLSGVVAAEHLAKDGTLDFSDKNANNIYEYLRETNPESLVKVCNMMIPFLMSEEQIVSMFEAMHIENDVTRLAVLLKTDSPLTYYIIFKVLKIIEDKVIQRKCCMAILKRQNDMAYNMVCFLKVYFGLDDLPARFSLKIEPYEISRAEKNIDVFRTIIEGKKPMI